MTFQAWGEATSILEKDDLLLFAEGFLNVIQQKSCKMGVLIFLPVVTPEVGDDDLRHVEVAVSLVKLYHAVLA